MGMKNIPEPAQSGSGRKCGANEERQHRRVFICGPTRCWELYQLRKMDVNLLLMKPDACSLVLSTGPGASPEPGSVLGLKLCKHGHLSAPFHHRYSFARRQQTCTWDVGGWGRVRSLLQLLRFMFNVQNGCEVLRRATAEGLHQAPEA